MGEMLSGDRKTGCTRRPTGAPDSVEIGGDSCMHRVVRRVEGRGAPGMSKIPGRLERVMRRRNLTRVEQSLARGQSCNEEGDAVAASIRRILIPDSAIDRDAARLLKISTNHRKLSDRSLCGVWGREGEQGTMFAGSEVAWAVVTTEDNVPLAACKILCCEEGTWVDEMAAVPNETGVLAAVAALHAAMTEPSVARAPSRTGGVAVQILDNDAPCVTAVCVGIIGMHKSEDLTEDPWFGNKPEYGGTVLHMPHVNVLTKLKEKLHKERLPNGTHIFTRLHRPNRTANGPASLAPKLAARNELEEGRPTAEEEALDLESSHTIVANAGKGACLLFAIDQHLRGGVDSHEGRAAARREELASAMIDQRSDIYGPLTLEKMVTEDFSADTYLHGQGIHSGSTLEAYAAWIRKHTSPLGANELRVLAKITHLRIAVFRRLRGGIWLCIDKYGERGDIIMNLKLSGQGRVGHFELMRKHPATEGEESARLEPGRSYKEARSRKRPMPRGEAESNLGEEAERSRRTCSVSVPNELVQPTQAGGPGTHSSLYVPPRLEPNDSKHSQEPDVIPHVADNEQSPPPPTGEADDESEISGAGNTEAGDDGGPSDDPPEEDEDMQGRGGVGAETTSEVATAWCEMFITISYASAGFIPYSAKGIWLKETIGGLEDYGGRRKETDVNAIETASRAGGAQAKGMSEGGKICRIAGRAKERRHVVMMLEVTEEWSAPASAFFVPWKAIAEEGRLPSNVHSRIRTDHGGEVMQMLRTTAHQMWEIPEDELTQMTKTWIVEKALEAGVTEGRFCIDAEAIKDGAMKHGFVSGAAVVGACLTWDGRSMEDIKAGTQGGEENVNFEVTPTGEGQFEGTLRIERIEEVARELLTTPDPEEEAHKAVGSRVMLASYWNTQQLHVGCGYNMKNAPANEREKKEGARTRAKLDFLDAQLQAERPCVLFLMEVAGLVKQWEALKKWFKVRGYAALFDVGINGKNGMVVAVDSKQGSTKLGEGDSTGKVHLADRTLGIEVRCKEDAQVRRFVCVHGISTETSASQIDDEGLPREQCFARQVYEAMAWTEESGGVICGDFNRVMCSSWRKGSANGTAHALTGDDHRIRNASGWRCACCDQGASGGANSIIIGKTTPSEEVRMTRWRTSGNVLMEETARIDYAISRGRERGMWKERHALTTDMGKRGKGFYAVSDHSFMTIERRIEDRARLDKRRPTPFPIGRNGDPIVRRTYEEMAHSEEFEAEASKCAEDAKDAKGGRLPAVTEALVRAATKITEQVRSEKKHQPVLGGETPHQRYQSWIHRLQAAVQLSAAGVSPLHLEGTMLQYCKQIHRMAKRRRPIDEVWRDIICRCRREVKRAGSESARVRKEKDAELYAFASDASKSQVDAVVRMQRAWRAISGPRANTALEAVFEGDEPIATDSEGKQQAGRRIAYSEPEFKAELKNVGEAFVRKMADTPACLPAFDAWCSVFMEEFELLKGLDGGEFVLAKELTWELFLEVLYSMPCGKAVGAGGFHAELLKLASEKVRRTFYDAMMADLAGNRIPEHWRKVLYALLIKPPPSNPDVVAERREIALMAHDMKMLLQMVRRVSYQRIVGRIGCDQAGWLAGFGCADSASIVASVVQQCVRLKQAVYMMYIDLSTFFPKLDRGAVAIAEAYHGLPKEVRDLTLRIYGSAEDVDGCVTCQYDSAAGLGDGFKNWMGALMGCVLSPDKAKLFLNSVLTAIKSVCTGVSLWGYGKDELRKLVHAAYADDWCGTFSSEQDLKKAWEVWRAWEAISGSKLGVKAKLKTVVTGAKYVNGQAVSVVDPLLRLRGGGYVPFAHHDEAYKHLGNMRTASGSDVAAWKSVKGKLLAALARIRKLHSPSVGEFIQVSNALLGGIAGYYLQTLYISFEQAEEIESRWRSIYRMKFGGSHLESESKPRAFFYQQRGGVNAPRRQHLWGVGLTAIATSFSNAMADAADTSQRAATRSAVALSMESWGCRADPNTWSWKHLKTQLEATLKNSQCKMLGDAWMLAIALLEEEHETQWEEKEGDRSAWARDFSNEQKAAWGRWRESAPEGEPLHRSAAHWRPPDSMMIAEPTSADGLGMEPESWLLGAGVVAVGHMCGSRADRHGGVVHRWLTFTEARRSNPRLPDHGAANKAWNRQVERMEGAGVRPVQEERVTSRVASIADKLQDGGSAERREGKKVDATAIKQLMSALEEPDVRSRRTKGTWVNIIKRCFPDAERTAAKEWEHGGRDRAQEARGAKYVYIAGARREPRCSGGEARWGKRCADGKATTAHDQEGVATGEDGWVEGWKEAAEGLHALMTFDEEGYAIDALGERVQGEHLGDLPPALQMSARARIEVGLIKPGCPVVDEAPEEKYKDTTINLRTQRHNHDELVEYQAKIDATAIYTADATRMVAGEKGALEYVVARTALRHDGVRLGGRMHEPEGADNYIGELAAQLDVANAEDVGGRIIIVFDATSPSLAMAKFRKMCYRRRQGYYVGEWLESLFRLLDRQEVVVLLWQNSHKGSPINEWADLCAAQDGCADRYEPVVRIAKLKSQTMLLTAPRRSTHGWAAPLACGIVDRKLRTALRETQMHDEYDVAPLALRDKVQQTCDAVLGQRSCIGDTRRYLGKAKSTVIGDGHCPLGCVDGDGNGVAFSWLHAQFFCQADELVVARGLWVETCTEASDAMRPADTNLPHDQIEDVKTIAVSGIATYALGGSGTKAIPPRLEISARRLVGALIRAPGDKKVEKSKVTRKVLVRMVEAGANVQWVAHKLTQHIEEEASAAAKDAALVRTKALRWLRITREAGPARVAALREVMKAQERLMGSILEQTEKCAISQKAAEAAVDELFTTGDAEKIVMGSAVSAALVDARGAHRRMGGGAYWSWRILALARRWRLIAALRQRSWEGVKCPIQEMCGEGPHPGGVIRVETVHARTTSARAVDMARQVLEKRDIGDLQERIPQRAELTEMEQNAHKKWRAGGCRAGVCRRRKELLKRSIDRAAQEQGRRFSGYMQQGMGTPIGLRGLPLAMSTGDGQITFVIGPRRYSRKRPASGVAAAAPRKRSTRQSMIDAGAMPDRWNRWKVEKVLEVRRVRGGTRANPAARLEMRLRWVGHDPNSGLPWPDKWVPDRDTEGNVANWPLMVEAQRIEEEKYGARISGKQGAADRHATSKDSFSAPLDTTVRKRKWDRVLRSGEGDRTYRGQAFKLGGKTLGIRDSDDDEESCSEAERSSALRDIRRRRLTEGASTKCRRRAVIEDEDGEDSEEEDGVVRLA